VSFGYPSSRFAAVAGTRSESSSAEVTVKRSTAPDFFAMIWLLVSVALVEVEGFSVNYLRFIVVSIHALHPTIYSRIDAINN
jgi:hypothetical protein